MRPVSSPVPIVSILPRRRACPAPFLFDCTVQSRFGWILAIFLLLQSCIWRKLVKAALCSVMAEQRRLKILAASCSRSPERLILCALMPVHEG